MLQILMSLEAQNALLSYPSGTLSSFVEYDLQSSGLLTISAPLGFGSQRAVPDALASHSLHVALVCICPHSVSPLGRARITC